MEQIAKYLWSHKIGLSPVFAPNKWSSHLIFLNLEGNNAYASPTQDCCRTKLENTWELFVDYKVLSMLEGLSSWKSVWGKYYWCCIFFKKWSRGKKETVWSKEERKSNKLLTLKHLWRVLKMSFVDIEISNKHKCDIPILLLVLKLVVIIIPYFNISAWGSFTNYSFKGKGSV